MPTGAVVSTGIGLSLTVTIKAGEASVHKECAIGECSRDRMHTT